MGGGSGFGLGSGALKTRTGSGFGSGNGGGTGKSFWPRRKRRQDLEVEERTLRFLWWWEPAAHKPEPTSTDGEAANPGPSMQRKRGPRSEKAKERRLQKKETKQQKATGKTMTLPTLTAEVVEVLHLNVQGFISHCTELTTRLRQLERIPDLVCLNETFLNKSVKEVQLEGFVLIARRDKKSKKKGGGIAVCARSDVASRCTLLSESETSERLWVQLHTDQGPFLLGVWYRPPKQGEVQTVETLSKEWNELRHKALGTILVGDMNVHHKPWLRHSSRNSAEGAALFNFCQEAGFKQRVKEPTREKHLLDLVLTDLEKVSCIVLPKIADHCLVLATLKISLPQAETVQRQAW